MYIKSCMHISVPEDCADPNGISSYAAFIWVFTVCQSTCLPLSRMEGTYFVEIKCMP